MISYIISIGYSCGSCNRWSSEGNVYINVKFFIKFVGISVRWYVIVGKVSFFSSLKSKVIVIIIEGIYIIISRCGFRNWCLVAGINIFIR